MNVDRIPQIGEFAGYVTGRYDVVVDEHLDQRPEGPVSVSMIPADGTQIVEFEETGRTLSLDHPPFAVAYIAHLVVTFVVLLSDTMEQQRHLREFLLPA